MNLTIEDIDRVIEMAWEDRTTFDAIQFQFGLKEQEVIELLDSDDESISSVEEIPARKANLRRSTMNTKPSFLVGQQPDDIIDDDSENEWDG